MKVLSSLELLAVVAVLSTSLLPGTPTRSADGTTETVPRAHSEFAALAFDMFDGSDVWAGNGLGVWRTDDNGKHWYEITPANLVGDDPAVRLTGFGWSGSQHLWFSAGEAGDVTGQGLRGFAIERSADGGRTWRWTALPSCTACSMSFSFLGPAHGFALGSNGNLYSTLDGGASWSLAPTRLPRSAVPALDFVSDELGWSSSGGLLERTDDGGRNWERAASPAPPRWPSRRRTSSRQPAASSRRACLRARASSMSPVTAGPTGRAEPVPAAPDAPTAYPGWFAAPAFEVTSPVTWALQPGRKLYVTGNAGRDWARVPSPPTYGKGDPIWGFAMATTSLGWLDAAGTPCGASSQDLCAVPVLLRTTDQGRTWRMVPGSSPAVPAASS